ncbi:hypothetical protein PILCRDRAFT_768385 [Piloderma croceum F 1598]|uniref:NAD(P)-binding protein n=1 Tax=Piloderma croceum (strain F 1598) TaxID=765440 RepID=A0A0C3FY83_PILCF|nr:hypothetical protein PILCRDRAFT_768385 [Piloderma croceum F 1598]
MSTLKSFLTQTFPPKPTYSVDYIPDLTGKTVIVTGGKDLSFMHLRLGNTGVVYIGARSQEKAEDLKESTDKEALFLKLDLADLKAVKTSAEEFLSKEMELHVLFNNGGVMNPPIEMLTADGYDLQFGTNVIGHFYFTKLLLPLLISTANISPDSKVRVVNTSSVGHMAACKLDFETFKDGPKRKRMASQLANVVYAAKLARRYGNDGIVSTSLHPGNLRSDLQRYSSGIALRMAMRGLTPLWAGTSPEGRGFNGKVNPCCPINDHAVLKYDGRPRNISYLGPGLEKPVRRLKIRK